VRRDRFRCNPKEKAPPPSVQAARQQVAEAEQAEHERAEEAKKAAAEHERQLSELREHAAGIVAEVERVVGDAVRYAVDHPATTSRRARPYARAWLHGTFGDTVDLMPPQNRVVAAVNDRATERLMSSGPFKVALFVNAASEDEDRAAGREVPRR
jgi:hypothetical protein